MNNFFDQIPFFAISKMAKNQFLNWGKLPKMQFHEKKNDLFDFTSFFAWTFLNFLARCTNSDEIKPLLPEKNDNFFYLFSLIK